MTTLAVETTRREELVDVGLPLERLLSASGVREGVIHLWSMHTTCALTVNENADPVLGRWQGVYLAEWDGPRTRQIAVKIVAD